MRNKSPPRKTTSNPGHQFGELDGEQVDNVGRQGEDGIVDHRETEIKDQTRSDNVKHGIILDLVEMGSVMEETDMESMGVSASVTTTAGFKSELVNVLVSVEPKQVGANINMSRSMHVITKDHVGSGPLEIKTKPTWTRLARMDCGPKNTTCAATKPTLGKRTSPCEEVVAVLGTESREKKRSRSQNEAQNNETVRVLEHPGQTP